MKPIRILLLYAQDANNRTLSYQYGWPRYFQRSNHFQCTSVNVQDHGLISQFNNILKTRRQHYDALILLHSVFSNAPSLTGRLLDSICASPMPKIFFIGNEYKLMPEKMAFCDALNLTLLVTQSHSSAVHDLYRNRLGCPIYFVPYTGLDTEVFQPIQHRVPYAIDLGYRSYDAPPYLGHNERRLLTDFFIENASRYNLKVDISLDPKDRFGEVEWATFLNSCKGQLGSEAGGDFFELTDETRLKIFDYTKKTPNATMEDIFHCFFKNYSNPIPLRVISGRNIEAAGTKTVQILFEGEYSGYLHPNVHYIPLKTDFSNIDAAIEKFRDEAFCHKITDNAYDIALQELTYETLIAKFYAKLREILS
jgi:hypothetical protein